MPAPTIRITVDDKALVALIAATAGKKPVRIVADGVEYGLFQEMGTVKMGAQPFMVPAVEAVRPSFVAAWKSVKSLTDAERQVQLSAEHVERLAKQYAPWETGALRSSIHIVTGETFEFEVGG